MNKVSNEHIDIFKSIMGNYPTGVTVITTKEANNRPIGMTVNSFQSVSIDPLMILWSIRKDATEFKQFYNADQFVVNILDGDNVDICNIFASKDKANRFNKVKWSLTEQDIPVLDEVSSIMECVTVDKINAGDHIIFLGEVKNLRRNSATPMLHYGRKLGHIPANW